jgi:hypothetical protein
MNAMARMVAMIEQGGNRPRFCSQCGERLSVSDANFCKQCGAPLETATGQWLNRDISWRPLVALILSIVPGLGQLYKGQPWRALLWFGGVTIMYSGAPPIGFLLHLICAGNAALAGAVREKAFIRRTGGFSTTAGPRP